LSGLPEKKSPLQVGGYEIGQWVVLCPLAGFGIALVAEARASSAD